MRKITIKIAIIAITLWILRYLISLLVKSDIQGLLLKYDIVPNNLTCSGGIASRTGHCTFFLNLEELKNLKTKLDKDLSAKKPDYQGIFIVDDIGDGECLNKDIQAEKLTAITQLGGTESTGEHISFPYLGNLWINMSNGKGCLHFQYGFG